LWRCGKTANWVVFCFLALNGTPKCKKRMKRNNKMQDKQVFPPHLDSTVAAEAEEQGGAKGRGMEEIEATTVAASGMCACMRPLTLP